MKKILAIVAAVALVAVGVVGTLAFQRAFEPSVKLTATSIQEQLTNSSELATAKLEYRGLVRYENGDIDFINKKGFTMVYDAEVRDVYKRQGVELRGPRLAERERAVHGAYHQGGRAVVEVLVRLVEGDDRVQEEVHHHDEEGERGEQQKLLREEPREAGHALPAPPTRRAGHAHPRFTSL